MSGLVLPSGTGVTGLWGKSAGTATATATPAAAGGGLFGGAATTNTGTGTGTAAGTGGTSGGGLFGAGSTATPTAASTTTTAAAAGGGLFGSSTPAAATTGTTPLFGNTASNPQPASQQTISGGGGLTFGCAPGSTTGGLNLGGAATTPAATTGGLFGSGTAAAAPTSAGGLFGQTTTQPAASQVSAVQINYESMRPRSRFDDLAPPVQSEIDLIDKGIQRVIKMRDEIGQFMPQHEKDIEQLGRDVHFVEAKFKTVQDALNRDIQTVKVLQDMTKKNTADGQLSFKAADNLKLPTHYHQTGLFAAGAAGDSGSGDASSAHASAQDLITYFNRICDDVERYKKRLDEYRSQIERDMPGVENGLYEQIRSLRDRSGSAAPVQDQLNQVLLALKETGNAIVTQAGVIADTRERLSRLQAGYLDGGYGGYGAMSS